VIRLPRAAQALNLTVAAVALALVVGAGSSAAAPRIRLANATGSLVLSNSKEGAAILRAEGMRPGVEASGSVLISNSGSVAATLRVAPTAAAVEVPGDGGGLLSSRLELRVVDVTDPQAAFTVYAGRLAAMPVVAAGDLAAGAERRLLFVATLPRGGAADDAFQGAQLAAGFTWTATGEETPATATATPTPSATPTPTPGGGDGGASGSGGGGTGGAMPSTTPPAGPSGPPDAGATLGDQVFSMPAATRCVSRRKFKIHVRRPRGVAFKQLTITVNRKPKVKLKGLKARKLNATVNLRGLPKGKVVVKIVAVTTTGAKLTSMRTYRTCAAKAKVKRAKKKRR
jgi:hypothetical protein